MVKSLKSYVKKQSELTKQLEDANEQLKYRDKLKDEFINVAALTADTNPAYIWAH